jgi:hypothetical protein
MKKIISPFVSFFVVFFLRFFIPSLASADSLLSAQSSKLEIGVETNELRFFHQSNDSLVVSRFSIGTARLGKATERLPYGKTFRVSMLILLPAYSPTEETRGEYFKKHKRQMKKFFLPGEKGNALGLLKLYFYNENGSVSTLGMHTSNDPRSIGKRVSHGCVRLSDKDAKEIATAILIHDGCTPGEAAKIIQQTEETRSLLAAGKIKSSWSLSKIIKIRNGPKVVYLRK